ncbi:MAG: hypothetical protein A2086_12190 [Spirochaetes bacterium GWD1_27_9]|nr:MAG: hypothetical protein A2Z98_06710 [Spirochaetes bacterium GWB1_27_13]OHD26204.1 MAG: hypothetical protein A2Y34_09640 [Spirochaetes bacterium GWC1_27_15]OHD35761.1 MAG: hypothetical protein A2086_12190 [Spirochaetes bacterium GWD1_27_9]
MEWKKDNYIITDSKDNIDIEFIVNSLNQTYWAEGRPKQLIQNAINNSILLSLFCDNKQIGFTRIVSDFSCFAWICDVFVDKKYRGNGLGKFLMECATSHSSTKVRTILLGTKDAHGLYEKYGFVKAEMMMKKIEYENLF